MIRWSPIQYLSNQCNKCVNLMYHLLRKFLIFVFRILTVRDWKMLLDVARDLSTDRHQKSKKPLNHSMLSDKSPRKDKFDENSWNGPARKFLTFCQFADLLIGFFRKSMQKSSVFWPREPRKMIEINIFWTNSKWSYAKVFWAPSIMAQLMTSNAWIILKLFQNSKFTCRSNIWPNMTDPL